MIVLTGPKATELLLLLDPGRTVIVSSELAPGSYDPALWKFFRVSPVEPLAGPTLAWARRIRTEAERLWPGTITLSAAGMVQFCNEVISNIEGTPTMNNSQSKLRLANIYLEQADTSRQQGNIDQSVEHFTKALDIYKKLADDEPACYELVADVIERIAATYKAAGDLPKAESAFAEAANLRETLLKAGKSEEEES